MIVEKFTSTPIFIELYTVEHIAQFIFALSIS